MVRPRGWHLPEKHVRIDGEAVSAALFDFALFLANNHEALARARHRPVFLPAQAGEPPRGAPVERRFRRGRAGTGHQARHDQGHGADRDPARRIRDGRDPVRDARAHRRPELRPLGLHIQLHQEIPEPPGLRAAGPQHADHGPALPEILRRPADQDLSPARRPCDGRHGGADSDQRTNPRQTSSRWNASSPTSCARHKPATTAPGSPTRGSPRRPSSRSGLSAAPNQLQVGRGDVDVRAPRPAAGAGRSDHGRGRAPQHARRHAVSRRVARRIRLRAAVQPDGGCGHGGDLPRPAVAMGPSRRAHRRRRSWCRSAGSMRCWRRSSTAYAAETGAERYARGSYGVAARTLRAHGDPGRIRRVSDPTCLRAVAVGADKRSE